MQKIITSFLCCTFFSLFLFAQQSIQLERGHTQGTNTPGKSYSLSWFTSEGLLSGGTLRLTYMNASEDVESYYLDRRQDMLQLDVSKRWHSSFDKRTTIFIETGLSGMALNSDVFYGAFDCFCSDCNCLSTAIEMADQLEKVDGLTYNYKNKYHQLSFLPGSTLGAGVDARLANVFAVGLNFRANTYFNYAKKDVIYYLTTAFTAGWRF